MKELYGTNFAGQIVYAEYTSLKGDNEAYQEYLDRANKIVDDDINTEFLLSIFDANNIARKALEEVKNINHKDIKEIIKNHNVVMMVSLMAFERDDGKIYDKIMTLRGMSLLEPIEELKKLVNNKNLFEVPLEELFSIFKESDFTEFFSQYRDS